ncbi:MAG: hypothetical protein WC641_01475 [Patescibacteria group bacterium]
MTYQAQAKTAAEGLIQDPDCAFQNMDVLLGVLETELNQRFGTWNKLSLTSETDLDGLSDEMARAACEILPSLNLSFRPAPDA